MASFLFAAAAYVSIKTVYFFTQSDKNALQYRLKNEKIYRICHKKMCIVNLFIFKAGSWRTAS